MFKAKSNSILGYREKEIPFTILSKKEDSTSLAILLPGSGYTVQAPLLHYTTGLFLNKSFDVLHVNYHYKDLSVQEINEAINIDVNAVIDHVLTNNSYETIYLIGKSIGTIAMTSILKRDSFEKAKAVWLTPLIQRDDVLDAMVTCKNKSLCIIGDHDPCYKEERYAQVVNNPYMKTKLIPKANHGLEYNDNTVESITVLRSVIKEIEQF